MCSSPGILVWYFVLFGWKGNALWVWHVTASPGGFRLWWCPSQATAQPSQLGRLCLLWVLQNSSCTVQGLLGKRDSRSDGERNITIIISLICSLIMQIVHWKYWDPVRRCRKYTNIILGLFVCKRPLLWCQWNHDYVFFILPLFFPLKDADILDIESKHFEDLEFQQLEHESRLDEEKENLTQQLLHEVAEYQRSIVSRKVRAPTLD